MKQGFRSRSAQSTETAEKQLLTSASLCITVLNSDERRRSSPTSAERRGRHTNCNLFCKPAKLMYRGLVLCNHTAKRRCRSAYCNFSSKPAKLTRRGFASSNHMAERRCRSADCNFLCKLAKLRGRRFPFSRAFPSIRFDNNGIR